MKKVALSLILIAAACRVALCQNPGPDAASFQNLARMFDYDRQAPLDIKENKVDDRSGVKVHDITYASPKGGRVPAFLVVPSGSGPFAGIIFMHWGLGDRSSFLPDAMLMARAGAVSVLIDAPFRRPAPWRRSYDSDWSNPENDRDMYLQTVVDLRRAVDLLASRKDVDANRIGYVGLSFGSHMGGILAGIERRIKTFILMGGLISLTDKFRSSNEPDITQLRNSMPKERFEKYLEVTGPLDAIHYIGKAAPTPILLQFAYHDRFISEKDALDFQKATAEPKQVKWYVAGHEFNDVDSLRDRSEWLGRHIGLRRLTQALPQKLGGKEKAHK